MTKETNSLQLEIMTHHQALGVDHVMCRCGMRPCPSMQSMQMIIHVDIHVMTSIMIQARVALKYSRYSRKILFWL